MTRITHTIVTGAGRTVVREVQLVVQTVDPIHAAMPLDRASDGTDQGVRLQPALHDVIPGAELHRRVAG